MKRACMSNCKDPENRSKKTCVCGGHSTNARKKRRPWRKLRQMSPKNQGR